MKQTIKKLWILIAMLWLSISASAYDFEVDGIAYNITSFSDLKCSVTSKETGYMGNITIPDIVSFNGKELSVTEIEDNAFQNNIDLIAVCIPSSVKVIGMGAFKNCVNLEQLTIQDGLCYIHSYSFGQCSKLKNVILPNTVKEIGNNCFEDCNALSEIKFSDKLSELGAYAFTNCSSLNTISLPNSLAVVKEHTFDGCTNLSEIQLGDELKEISDYAFSECDFMSFTVPNSVTDIGKCILDNCKNLETFSIGTGLSVIYSNPISNCPNVKNFIILDGFSSLKFDFSNENYKEIRSFSYGGKYYYYNTRAGAFKDADFEYVYIGRPIYNPSEIFKWEQDYSGRDFKNWSYSYTLPPFYGNKNIKAIEFGKNAKAYSTEILCEGGESYVYGWLEECESLETIEGLDLKEIGINFAKNATSLKNLEILSATSNIGDYAFWGCSSLDSIIIGPSVINIGKNAFTDCNALKSIFCKSAVPPTYSSEFSKEIYLNCDLYIPLGTETEYRNTSPWNNFWNMEESI
ncbi:MAG: leucine-rich repeat domain-containing protein, partial [Muribaculaceae bacterium]|nr:leucine-rich repeat domain-containing protein [Muribaculaceae bacterium]